MIRLTYPQRILRTLTRALEAIAAAATIAMIILLPVFAL